jgi:CDP-glucose 4,6-dehydratase
MNWSGKRVFLTGHTGFKGGWLSLWLQRLGATVRGYSLEPPTDPSLYEVARVAKGMESVRGDIRDLARLCSAVREFRPEIVIHMAAQPLVRKSYEVPVETFATNVLGTANMLEAVRGCDGVRAVLVITTDKCYENHGSSAAFQESDRLGGYDPYSSSKACAELVVSSYRNSFFNPERYSTHGVAVASARAGNVIGGGDWATDRLVPDVVRSFMGGTPVLIRNPKAVRPWQHVLEPLRGYLCLCERLVESGAEFGEAWNFGPEDNDARPVEWIADRLVSLWGNGAKWLTDDGRHPHEAHTLRLDWSKASARLDWKPALNLSEALEITAKWYKAWQENEDMREVTQEQIERIGAYSSTECSCRAEGLGTH